jgi:DNA-binding transcriptional ArsR family regulator
MSESSVSHHLRVLRTSGLARARREGRMVFYSPDDAHIEHLLALTREHVQHQGMTETA